ncbi:dolichyl-phosphate-mannose--protein mannosyltransferase [Natronosporangium hydrolyticum]|uniref:dolichyl-phosphate-mannose--protein mannosyltransferase n=1 Tax=Natronosporangium hydrolyticum TaxID=2811111 RepID=UPI003B847675
MSTVATEAGPSPADEPVPEITQRRLTPLVPPHDPWSWVVAAVVTTIAAIVRLVDLSRPGHIVFDETYYAPNAWALVQYGVEWEVAEGGANPVDGAPVLGDGPAFVVHPPLGKWLIGLGEWAFGYTPFGWRIAAALAGIISVLLVARIARRLFGSTMLGAAAGLLVALDGMHVVMSRTALLDIFLLLFVVAGFGALLLDRDQRRSRWLAALAAGRDRPGFGVPWWRLAAGALLGCALAVKWSAVAFIPVFLGLALWWEVSARRTAGVRRPWRDTVAGQWRGFVAATVLIPVVYLATWIGWFTSDHGFYRHAPVDAQGEPWPARVVAALRNLYEYHAQALTFHSGLDATHPYESPAWQWLLLARPIAFHYSDQGGCGAEHCASAVLLLGTPLLWWSFLPALAALVWLGVARRDWRAGAILLGVAAGIGPWFLFDDRVMFYFYALPAQPFLVLAVVYVLGAVMSSARPRSTGDTGTILGVDRRTFGAVLVGGYVILVALTFAYFYPVYSAQLIPYESWQARMWLDTWI